MHARTQENEALHPAVVTVGNELTFGERRNGNQEWLCQQLFNRGTPASIVLSLPDDVPIISHWIQSLRAGSHFPILVSGGIGGTHDDCTRQSIATGLALPLTRHPACFDILALRYGDRFNEQRQRMTMLPDGCDLIDNPLGAPGFKINGIFAFPGFPNMLQPMFETVAPEIFGNNDIEDWQTVDYALAVAEGDIAMDIESFDAEYDGVHLGIYPSTEKFRREVTVRLRYPRRHTSTANAFRSLVLKLAKRHGVNAVEKPS